MCTSASVVSAMVKRTAGARPIPMTWLRHWFSVPARSSLAVRNSRRRPGLVHHVTNNGVCRVAESTYMALDEMALFFWEVDILGVYIFGVETNSSHLAPCTALV